VAPLGAISFADLKIHVDARDPVSEMEVETIVTAYADGKLSRIDAENALETMMAKGKITIEDTSLSGSAIAGIGRNRLKPKTKNPLSGKGKSYGEHVSGPNGWGQYVRPDPDAPF